MVSDNPQNPFTRTEPMAGKEKANTVIVSH